MPVPFLCYPTRIFGTPRGGGSRQENPSIKGYLRNPRKIDTRWERRREGESCTVRNRQIEDVGWGCIKYGYLISRYGIIVRTSMGSVMFIRDGPLYTGIHGGRKKKRKRRKGNYSSWWVMLAGPWSPASTRSKRAPMSHAVPI